jgi:hypothetical protein
VRVEWGNVWADLVSADQVTQGLVDDLRDAIAGGLENAEAYERYMLTLIRGAVRAWSLPLAPASLDREGLRGLPARAVRRVVEAAAAQVRAAMAEGDGDPNSGSASATSSPA